MLISNMVSGMKKIDTLVKIDTFLECIMIHTKYGRVKLYKYIISDNSGNIILVVWGERGARLEKGNLIIISNAYCNKYLDELQLVVSDYSRVKVREI